jgi:hypothetical protein
MVGMVWRAVRPVGPYQRLVWWAGTLMLASGIGHGVIALIDGGSWWGPVSWRKPALFGLAFGLMLWTVVWLLRQLPGRWWVRVPAGLVMVCSAAELVLITMQRWRGTASHFNRATEVDSGVWTALGMLIIPLTLGIALLLVAVLVRFHGTPAARIAALAGLAGVLVAGYVGTDMAAIGEAAVDATGRVPHDVMFGAAGSAKLAHAVGLHGIQALAVLAIALEAGRLTARVAAIVMAVGSAGFAAVFAAVLATAYAGRAPFAPTVPMALLLVGGLVTVGTVASVAVANLSRERAGAAGLRRVAETAEFAGRAAR